MRIEEISARLLRIEDLSLLLQEILDAAMEITASDMGNLQLLEQGVLRIVAQRGFDAAFLDFFNEVHEGQAACGNAIQTGKRVVIEDIVSSPIFADKAAAKVMTAANVLAVQSTPLVSRSGRVLGVVSTHYRKAPHRPSDHELKMLDLLVRQAADLIERKQAEQASARLAAIVDCSDDAIISIDLNGYFTSWNKGAERLYGYSAEETIGRPVMTLLIPPDRLNEELDILQRICRGERIEHYETVRCGKDGTLLDVSLSVSPIIDTQGKVVGASKIARDISERKRAEEALRQSHAELRLYAEELAHFNRVAVGREMRVMELKREINQLRERQGEPAKYTLEVEPAEAEPKTFAVADIGEGHVPLESILCTEELNQRPRRAPNYKIENRALAALIEALADSPRNILQALAEKILEVLHADSAGVSLLTKDEKRFYWAAIAGAWQPHLGGGTPRDFGPCGDVLDRNLPLLFKHWELRYPYLLPATPLAEEALLVPFYVKEKAVGTIWAIAHNRQRKFDAEDLRLLEILGRFASAAYQAIESLEAFDQRRAALSLMEDAVESRQLVEDLNLQLRSEISERKRAEENLQKLNVELENRVSERTSELLSTIAQSEKLHEQLLQAQKMESIGTLAGGIAHDFNNILNIIRGYASILNGYAAQNTQIRESFRVINDTVERGAALVQQLLTLARKGRTELRAIDANLVIEEVRALISQTFPKTIEFRSRLGVDLPSVRADKGQIEQALLNICLNARDAMPEGGKLTFTSQCVDGAALQGVDEAVAQRYVCIEVRDTGIGMNESIRKRIFEPFFTTKEMGRGTGLGLSVVYGIMKNHDGFVTVESEPNSGTSFRLYFPVATNETSATDAVLALDTTPEQASSCGGTIFLVEDEPNMVYLLEKILLQQGYKVLTAADGETALATYQTHKDNIDVVLLDIGLPKIAGRHVLSQMKEYNPNVRIVVTSGYSDPELESKIQEAGVKHFLQKPYTPNQVIKILRSVIEEQSDGCPR